MNNQNESVKANEMFSSMSAPYLLPARLIAEIEAALGTTNPNAIVLTSSSSFGIGGRVYYRKNGMLMTSLVDGINNIPLPRTELRVISIDNVSLTK